jgi:hypothetical protein
MLLMTELIRQLDKDLFDEGGEDPPVLGGK